jgi:hypothetical protein
MDQALFIFEDDEGWWFGHDFLPHGGQPADRDRMPEGSLADDPKYEVLDEKIRKMITVYKMWFNEHIAARARFMELYGPHLLQHICSEVASMFFMTSGTSREQPVDFPKDCNQSIHAIRLCRELHRRFSAIDKNDGILDEVVDNSDTTTRWADMAPRFMDRFLNMVLQATNLYMAKLYGFMEKPPFDNGPPDPEPGGHGDDQLSKMPLGPRSFHMPGGAFYVQGDPEPSSLTVFDVNADFDSIPVLPTLTHFSDTDAPCDILTLNAHVDRLVYDIREAVTENTKSSGGRPKLNYTVVKKAISEAVVNYSIYNPYAGIKEVLHSLMYRVYTHPTIGGEFNFAVQIMLGQIAHDQARRAATKAEMDRRMAASDELARQSAAVARRARRSADTAALEHIIGPPKSTVLSQFLLSVDRFVTLLLPT